MQFDNSTPPLAKHPLLMGPDPCNLIVNYIPTAVTDDILRDLFTPFGTVVSSRVIVDHFSNHPKGYGFVKFTTKEAAKNAIASMNGFKIGNKYLRVTQANGPQCNPNRLVKVGPSVAAGPTAPPYPQMVPCVPGQPGLQPYAFVTADPQMVFQQPGVQPMYQTVILAQPPPPGIPQQVGYVTAPQQQHVLYEAVNPGMPKTHVYLSQAPPLSVQGPANVGAAPVAEDSSLPSFYPPFPLNQQHVVSPQGCTLGSQSSSHFTSSQALTMSGATIPSGVVTAGEGSPEEFHVKEN